MFIAALFTIIKIWIILNSMDEWSKMHYEYTVEVYVVIKRIKSCHSLVTKWIEPEDITLVVHTEE